MNPPLEMPVKWMLQSSTAYWAWISSTSCRRYPESSTPLPRKLQQASVPFQKKFPKASTVPSGAQYRNRRWSTCGTKSK